MKIQKLYLVGFLALTAFDTMAQLSFKFAGKAASPTDFSPEWFLRVATEPFTYGAILGYLLAFVTWMTLLKHVPIGPAFAASHLEIVTVMLISFIFLGESMNAVQLFGCFLIVVGILFLAYEQQRLETIEHEGVNTPAVT